MNKAAFAIREWREDPVKFVWDNFGVVPDEWQKDALLAFVSEDRDMRRVALSACAGVGKSAAIAWCALLFIGCYCRERGEHPRGAVMSTGWDVLQDTLWSEIAKWMGKSDYFSNAFLWTRKRIYNKFHEKTWYLSARSYSKTASDEEQGRTLSGLHAQNIAYFIDESGDTSVTVLKSTEQGLSDCIFGKIITAGNPTSHNGLLHYAVKEDFENWHVINITGDPDNPKRSPRVDIDQARDMINKFGREDSWVMAYILGLFPKQAVNTLLTQEEVKEAIERGKASTLKPTIYERSQKRLGIDVALYGDDNTVIFPRQGLRAFAPVVMRDTASDGQAPMHIAARVMQAKNDWGCELEFVDCTGGYGDGVVSYLVDGNADPVRVNFSSKASDSRKYYNKRTEMYFLMRDWVRGGGILPDGRDLIKELSTPCYELKGGKLKLEEKLKIKERLKRSPDKADALALTFAFPDMPADISSLFPELNSLNLNNNDRQSIDDWESDD